MSLVVDGVRVEVAFTTTPDDPSPAYQDITTYCDLTRGITINRYRQDEYATVQPGTCTVQLNNDDGRFTADRAASPYYPNVKIRKKMRVTYRAAGSASGNHLTANAASMETDVSSWGTSGTGPTLSQSTTHAEDGTKALLVTWATGASGSEVAVTSDYALPLVIGRTYTAQLRVYVPTGSPVVAATAPDVSTTVIGTPTVSAVNDAFTTVSVTFIAGVTTPNIGIATAGASTAGQQCWVDKVMVDEGSAVGTFTTSAPLISYRFTGYVDEWPTEWPNGSVNNSDAVLVAVDRLKRLGSLDSFRSIIEQEYLLDSPFAYYTLGEPTASTTVGDTSKNGCNSLATAQLGSGGTLTFGNATGPSTDSLTALQLAPSNATNGKYLSGALGKVSSNASSGQSIECFFLTSTAAVQSLMTLVGPNVNPLTLSITATGKLQGASFNSSGVLTSSASVNDGLTHHAAVVQSYTSGTTTITLYLDGVSVGTTSFSDSLQQYNAMKIGGSTGSVFNGTIAHVACYDSALSTARVSAHSTAGSTGFSGERSDQRVARYAGYVGISTAEQSLETGLTTSVAFVDITGQTPLDAMRAIEATESGVLAINGAGQLLFQARSHRYNAPSVLTLTGDDVDPSARFVANDAYLVNDVTASRPNGITFRATNSQSITDYGAARQTPSLLTTSDNEVMDAANWKANQTAIPSARLPNMTVDIFDNPTIATSVLALDLSSRVTVSSLPTQAPTSSTDVFIEGWTENISDSGYAFAFNTSPAPQSGVWQLDSSTYSVLGTSTRLAY